MHGILRAGLFSSVMAVTEITFYHGTTTTVYTVGTADVININVHFNFANVVHVVIYFGDGSRLNFYNIPCKTYTPPPS
jgi:hypothetical protein